MYIWALFSICINNVLKIFFTIDFNHISFEIMTSYKILLSLFFLIPFFTIGQSSDKITSVNKKIETLNRKKFEDPRKTLSELTELSYSDIPDTILGTVYLEMSVCYGMMNQMDSGILFANKAVTLNKNPVKKIATYKTLGLLYVFAKNNNLAKESFEKALKECDKIPENLDMKALVLGEFANFYYENNDFLNNLKLLRQAIEIREKIPNDNPQFMATLRQKMSATFIAMGDYDFAEKENIAIIRLLENNNNEYRLPFLGYAYQNIGLAKQHQKNFKASDSFFLRSIEIFSKIENKDMVGYSLAELAKNKMQTNQFDSGLVIIDRAFLMMKKASSTYILEAATIYLNILHSLGRYEQGKKIYADSFVVQSLKNNFSKTALDFYKAKVPFLRYFHDKEEELNNMNIMLTISDSVYNQEKLKSILELQTKYQIQLKEKDEKILIQQNNLKTRLLFIWLIIGSAIILFFMYRSARNRLRSEKTTAELKIKSQENELLSQKVFADEEEKKLKEIIIEQQKNDLLIHTERIEELEKYLQDISNKNIEQEKEEIRKYLDKLKEGKEYLNMFMAKYNTIYPNFSQSLLSRFPSISNSDIVFCALTRINLTPKEIGAVLNIEQVSVYKRKYRIMEKMNIKTDEEFRNIVWELS